jgi:hypothetical protein
MRKYRTSAGTAQGALRGQTCVARLHRLAPSLQHPRPGWFLLNFGTAQFKTGFNRLINMAKKSLCLRELRGLRASSSSSGPCPPFHGGFRCVPGRRKTRTEVTVFTEGLTDIELTALAGRFFMSEA